MEFKLFGIKLRLEVILLCIALGMVIGTELLCSCVKKDGFAVASALYNKTMNNGIPSLRETFETIQIKCQLAAGREVRPADPGGLPAGRPPD